MSLSSSGDRLVVGSDGDDSEGTNSGKIEIYASTNSTGTTWVLIAQFNGKPGFNNLVFGRSTAISGDGNTVVASSHSYNNFQGYIDVYRYNSISNTWIQLGSSIIGVLSDEMLGFRVGISTDGNTIVSSSPRYSTKDNPGIVRLYKWNGTQWGEIMPLISGLTASDGLGKSTAISGDGSVLAVCAEESYSPFRGFLNVYNIISKSNDSPSYFEFKPKIPPATTVHRQTNRLIFWSDQTSTQNSNSLSYITNYRSIYINYLTLANNNTTDAGLVLELAGMYLFQISGWISGGQGNGSIRVQIYRGAETRTLNPGVLIFDRTRVNACGTTGISESSIFYNKCLAGDYVRCMKNHNNTGTLVDADVSTQEDRQGCVKVWYLGAFQST